MLFQAYAYTSLVSGLIMIFTSCYSIEKIWQGSKSTFAYALLAFTMLDGVQNFSTFFIYQFS